MGEALAHLRTRLGEIAERYPPVGRLAVCGHAHIDLAWLWPLEETRRKIRRTVATVLALMEREPAFRFNQSSAQIYAFLAVDDPVLFEQVRQRVAEGRWEPVGGMWVEPDCNLTSGESLVRQLLYGQRYFARAFGRRATVAWLPDCFGFTAALPQILAGAGLRSFFTQKLSWNETNAFPYDLWLWEGLDGTRILAHSFRNPSGGYNGQVTSRALLATWQNFRGKVLHPESLFTYGYGDGGGGPTAGMLERIEALRDFPVLPRLRHATVEEFYAGIDPAGLPVWAGELYLELHRGTYTTQAAIKRLNRAAEHRLYEAEAAMTLAWVTGAADGYPRARLDEAWTALLRNQFHDILPGSSIREVNEEAERELAAVVETATDLRDSALAELAAKVGAGSRLIVFNLHGADRPLCCRVALPERDAPFRLVAADGREVPYQRLADGGLLVRDPGRTVPGLGCLALVVEPGSPALTCHPERSEGSRAAPSTRRDPSLRSRSAQDDKERNPHGAVPFVMATEALLENDVLRVTLSPDGALAAVYDKRAGRDVLDGPGNQLWAYPDRPRAWEAWDIDAGYEAGGRPVTEVESCRMLETGPLQASVEVVRRYRASRVTQRYVLRAGSGRLDIRTRIDWHERRILLRALFPLAVRCDHATYETAYGAVSRPAHRNTSWDAARFEVPAHRWADLSEAGYGVSLLNDGKYGHSAHGNVLGLSLLRSPVFPDPLADLGTHEFTYALLPHAGGWRAGGTVAEAVDLNSPLVGVWVTGEVPPHPRPLSPAGERGDGTARWLAVDGLTLGALKRAEDGDDVVLRLYDPYGGRGVAEVAAAFPLARAALANLLEDEIEEVPVLDGYRMRLAYRPYQIVTLRLTPEAGHAD